MSATRAQMWFSDFALGLFIFTMLLIIFYSYINDLEKPDVVSSDAVISAAQTISSVLVLSGVPSDWANDTVEIIGLTNNNHEINASKITQFNEIPYNKSKKNLGTSYDYFISFQNEGSNASNVEGICGIGHPALKTGFNDTLAYYFDSDATAYLKPYMESIGSSVFSAQPGYDDIDDLTSRIADFDFILLEHPKLSDAQWNLARDTFEWYVDSGKKLMLIGELSTNSPNSIAGITYAEKASQTVADRNATITKKHPSFGMGLVQDLVFESAHYAQNNSNATSFQVIARFSDNTTAMAAWDYGFGSVLFLSDSAGNSTFFDTNLVMQRSIPSWGAFLCNEPNVGNLTYSNLVKIDRLLVHNAKPVKMVVYAWR